MAKKKDRDVAGFAEARRWLAKEVAPVFEAGAAEEEGEQEAGLESPAQAETCPTFTLRADKAWQLLGLIVIWNHLAGHPLGMPAEDRPGLEAAVREFEKWEEAHR